MNALDKILMEIDKIEDDAEFCEAEHDAILDYCSKCNFKLTDDEMETIKARGLYDSFLFWLDLRKEMEEN